MLEGDANAAPAPKIAAPVASTENAIDMTDRFASTQLSTAGDTLSTLTAILPTSSQSDL
jgi:hypothetical protein